MPETTKVLIVDDSRIFRGVLQQALAGMAGVSVVGSVWNGVRAMEFLARTAVDLVTLDLEMPQMSGLDMLRAVQELNTARAPQPPVAVLLVSAYTSRGAAITIEGLELGAFDFITKPAGNNLEENLAYLRRELENKLRIFQARHKADGRSVVSPPGPPAAPPRVATAGKPRMVRAIVVGVSTGGPAALAQLLPELTARVPTPILVVQHIPAGFSQSLAESLARKCAVPVIEAADGQLVQGRNVYIAPGHRHLLVRRQSEERFVLALNDQPPQNGCQPSADVLFRAAAATYGAEAIGLILTGMGCDGTQGLAALKRAGAYTIAQDEASSVVWGMPGSAVAAGHIDRVLPLSKMAEAIQGLIAGARERKPDDGPGGA
jgi:two-component system chemotaxis response regulator CheB